jgi:hypothetical protein
MSKLALQDAAEELKLADDPTLGAAAVRRLPQADAARPMPTRSAPTGCATRSSPPRSPTASSTGSARASRFDLTEEEGASLPQVAAAFLVAERLLDLDKLWERDRDRRPSRAVRIELFAIAARSVRAHLGRHPPRRRRRHQRQRDGARCSSPASQDRGARDQADPRRGARRSGGAPRPADRARRERDIVRGWSACSSSTACSGSPRWARARATSSA